ncbi:MAG: hypothetical protein KTR24_13400 [Saprospiraceae bacterium]|nr:hypothetical protein [Saprospiraceae bacterium]
MEKAYRNLGYVLMLLIPLTILAFFKTYFGQFPNFEGGMSIDIHLHALVASTWILMLIVQPILIKKRNMHWHRRIGKISYFVFPLLILSFIPQMIRMVDSGNAMFLFFPLSDSLLLTLCYTLAIYYRRNASKHMRYMIGTAIVFLGPTIGRIGPLVLGWSEEVTQNIQYGVIYLILVGLIGLDRTKGKSSKPYLHILGMWVVHQIVFNVVF